MGPLVPPTPILPPYTASPGLAVVWVPDECDGHGVQYCDGFADAPIPLVLGVP